VVLLLKFEAMALPSSEATSYSRPTLSNCSNVSNVSDTKLELLGVK